MAIGHTTSLFYCKLGGSQQRRVQTAAACYTPTPPPFSVTRAIDLLAIYRTVRTTELKMNREEFLVELLRTFGGGAAANNRLIFARAVVVCWYVTNKCVYVCTTDTKGNVSYVKTYWAINPFLFLINLRGDCWIARRENR